MGALWSSEIQMMTTKTNTDEIISTLATMFRCLRNFFLRFLENELVKYRQIKFLPINIHSIENYEYFIHFKLEIIHLNLTQQHVHL